MHPISHGPVLDRTQTKITATQGHILENKFVHQLVANQLEPTQWTLCKKESSYILNSCITKICTSAVSILEKGKIPSDVTKVRPKQPKETQVRSSNDQFCQVLRRSLKFVAPMPFLFLFEEGRFSLLLFFSGPFPIWRGEVLLTTHGPLLTVHLFY